jgi:eukaryotic-like serine/threonine-protein kinase
VEAERANCLEETTVVAFLGGSLAADTRAAVEEHIASCAACAELVTWAAAEDAYNTASLPGHERVPFLGQLPPGAQVERYQILGALGRGGMGEVYAAYHPDLDRRIALKVVHALDGDTGQGHARLLREARTIARLSHPNVITVHDAGTYGDGVYIAMELVDGQTIDHWLRAGPRTWQQILDVFVAAGRGLAAAHAAGVVHRDFKPQNVMIAKTGAVRVMDFGLARMTEDDAPEPGSGGTADDAADRQPPVPTSSVTKTGAILGTPAYMSPEQHRRERLDARSDQFSFCVALHEALYGTRPTAARSGSGELSPGPSRPFSRLPSRVGVPVWIRSILRRGASPDREARYRSMDEILAALERGRTRVRRRVSVIAASLATVILTAAAWRVGHGSRFACAVPNDRVAAVWAPGDAADPRRQSIHRAFKATGRATAETSWERVSRVLDDYVNGWSAMYLQTCEATHVRGEQSAEVLDLRMSCLTDSLDQVRALTDALRAGDPAILSHAVTSTQDLTPVKRCADLTLLRAAVPPPKDERTQREVEALRSSLRDLEVLRESGDRRRVLSYAMALRPRVEATGYKPMLASLLELMGSVRMDIDDDPSEAEAMLRESMVVAEQSRDDLVAAKAATALSFLLTYKLGDQRHATFSLQLAMAFLDRSGPGNERFRAWAQAADAIIHYRQGDFEQARALAEASVALREKTLGPHHPDVAIGLTVLAVISMECDRPATALQATTRAIDILKQHGDPEGFELAVTMSDHGDALLALARYAEAERVYQESLRIFREQLNPEHPESASPLHGLGVVKLAQNRAREALAPLEAASQICAPKKCEPILAAEIDFDRARALWESGGDRTKARSLATAALASFKSGYRLPRQHATEAWLSAHWER